MSPSSKIAAAPLALQDERLLCAMGVGTFCFTPWYMYFTVQYISITIHLTKTAAAQTEDALSYNRVRGLYFLAVVFAVTILML